MHFASDRVSTPKVPATVVSHRKVEAASPRDLLVGFHRRLISSGKTGEVNARKAEALRAAALMLLKDPETAHPFH